MHTTLEKSNIPTLYSNWLVTRSSIAGLTKAMWALPTLATVLTGALWGRRLLPMRSLQVGARWNTILSLFLMGLGLAGAAAYKLKIKRLAYSSPLTFTQLAKQLKPFYEAYFTSFAEKKKQSEENRTEFRHGMFMGEFLESHSVSWPVSADEWERAAKEFLCRRIHEYAVKNQMELFQNSIDAGLPDSPHKGGFYDIAQKENYPKDSRIDVLGDIQGGVGGLLNYLKSLEIRDDFTLPNHAPHIVLIGDLIDGSVFGYEVWYVVFRLAIANPGKVTIIKGNHELYDIGNVDEFRYKFAKQLKIEESQNLRFRSINDTIFNTLALSLPALYIADNEGQLCCFSHSIDPKAIPNLNQPSGSFAEVSYQDQTALLDNRDNDLKIHENAKVTLQIPDGQGGPGAAFGMNKCLVHIKNGLGESEFSNYDLYPARGGSGVLFMSERVVEIWLDSLQNGYTVRYWTVGHHDEPTHGQNKGIAVADLADHVRLTILDASFDDIATNYEIPVRTYKAVKGGWQATESRIVDAFGFYSNKQLLYSN